MKVICKLIILLSVIFYLSGCASIGLNKRFTAIPDEIWISSETNPNEEDTGKITFGFKWKLEQKGE
jgi:hypothetical protein